MSSENDDPEKALKKAIEDAGDLLWGLKHIDLWYDQEQVVE